MQKNRNGIIMLLLVFMMMTFSILLTGCENPFHLNTEETTTTTEETTEVTTTTEATTTTITAPPEVNNTADANVCERMEVEVYLHGTVEEKAEQLCGALKEKYPDLPFEQRKNGVCLPVERDSTLSTEEIDNTLLTWLDGDVENIKTKTVPEMYEYAKYFVKTDIGRECNEYFLSKTQHVFIKTT